MNHGVLQGFSSVPRNTEQKVYGAGVVTDPRMMPICMAASAGVYKTGTGTSATLDAGTPPTCFTYAVINSEARTNVVTLTGSGFVTHIISNAGNALSTAIPTLFIEVDGTSYKFVGEIMGDTNRVYLGSLAVGSVNTTTTAVTQGVGGYNDGGAVGKTGRLLFKSGVFLPAPYDLHALNLPRLRFEKSFKVDISWSVAPTTAANKRNAIVAYQMD